MIMFVKYLALDLIKKKSTQCMFLFWIYYVPGTLLGSWPQSWIDIILEY